MFSTLIFSFRSFLNLISLIAAVPTIILFTLLDIRSFALSIVLIPPPTWISKSSIFAISLIIFRFSLPPVLAAFKSTI